MEEGTANVEAGERLEAKGEFCVLHGGAGGQAACCGEGGAQDEYSLGAVGKAEKMEAEEMKRPEPGSF